MQEPQIGIEPMTARQGKGATNAASLCGQSTTIERGRQGVPEPRPNVRETGNEVATGDATWTRLGSGQTRHEYIVQQLVAHGWKVDGLREALRARALKELAADGAPEDLDGDDPLTIEETEWGAILTRLYRRIPDVWRIVEEGREEGWGHPVSVLEMGEVVVTHGLTEAKQVDYASLWLTADACDYVAVRYIGFGPDGRAFPILPTVDDCLNVLRRSASAVAA